MRRVNVSLDTLDPARFKAITRRGNIDRVLAGIDAAKRAGLAVKINAVALKGRQRGRIRTDGALGARAGHGRSRLIEVMPMGEIEADALDQYLPLSHVRAQLARHFTLEETDYRTGGPARYLQRARNRRR